MMYVLYMMWHGIQKQVRLSLHVERACLFLCERKRKSERANEDPVKLGEYCSGQKLWTFPLSFH